MTEEPTEILLVEDNPSDIKLTLHAFQKYQLTSRIRVVRDGAAALEFLVGTEPSQQEALTPGLRIILLDLKLPLVDGLDVLRQIKQDPRTQMIPVVILTTSREERDVREGYRLGANSYIVKPVDYDQFTEMVNQLSRYWLQLNEPPPSQEKAHD